MFNIYDGRSNFYQWDLDRKLIVYDETIKEVHFCNKTDDCSLVCEVYKEGELNLVNVPNILLQDDWRINVYAYDGKYTKHSVKFDVVSRSKPADYIYTETEVKTYKDIEARIAELEGKETAACFYIILTEDGEVGASAQEIMAAMEKPINKYVITIPKGEREAVIMPLYKNGGNILYFNKTVGETSYSATIKLYSAVPSGHFEKTTIEKPDWNAQENEKGYILNRPFGETEGYLLPPTKVEFYEEEGLYISYVNTYFKLIDGETYVVEWNGEVYSCVATDGIIGNDFEEDNEVPFIIVPDYESKTTGIIALDNDNPKTIGVKGKGIKQIDKIYLPKIEISDLPPNNIPSFDFCDLIGYDTPLTNNSKVRFNIDNELYNSILEAATNGIVRFDVPVFLEPRENDSISGVFALRLLANGSGLFEFNTILKQHLISIYLCNQYIEFNVRLI